jgi:hypothetical protein
MQHIDEHTIELYILSSDLVKKQIAEIEAHLKECHGCRKLAEQVEAFYQNAEKKLDKLSVPKERETKALVRINEAVEQYYEPFAPPVRYRPTTFVGKLAYFTRLHPVITGVGSFATAAAMLGAILVGTSDFFKDKNPSYAHLNSESAIIEIYNKENQFLWGLPSKSIYRLPPQEYERMEPNVVIADINGGKRNDVLTILPLGDKTSPTKPLTIISPEGKLIREISFNENIQFRGTQYYDRLGGEYLLCDDFQGSGKKEIYVVTNGGRSPNIVNRLSNDGTILGQYFHFGLGNIQSIQIGQKRKAVFLGQNDVGEPDSLSYPIMSVLDPSKIIGKTEASESRGFDLPLSSAEMFVIRFPLSDMNIFWNTHSRARNLKETITNNRKTYIVWICGTFGESGLGSGSNPTFEYIFNEKMEIVEVKYDSETSRLRKEFIARGKLTGTMDKPYLENIKNGVRYWNGTSWQKEPTMVKPQQ